MPSCVFRYCNNYTSKTNKCKGTTFHRFPCQSSEYREKWIKIVQKDRSEEAWLPSNCSYVCSLHFREEDKYLSKGGRVYLKKSAVPFIGQGISHATETNEINVPISEECVSESESIFDSPKEICLKSKIQKLTSTKQRLITKVKTVKRQNRYLKKKCEYLSVLVKSLKAKVSELSGQLELPSPHSYCEVIFHSKE